MLRKGLTRPRDWCNLGDTDLKGEKKDVCRMCTAVALMRCAGCAFMSERAEWRDEWRNEVVSLDVLGLHDGHFVTNIEQASVPTDTGFLTNT